MKNVFEVFAQMNKKDITDGTKLIQISTTLTGTKKVKEGVELTYGIPEELFAQCLTGEYTCILLAYHTKTKQSLELTPPVQG